MAARLRPLHDVDVHIGNQPFHGTIWLFHCPGCGYGHWFAEGQWQWNGDVEKPDVSPSIKTGDCHLFLRNGMIEFCSDSKHELAGKTVPFEDWD